MGQVQPLADLAVRQALRRELCDLQLLRGELVARRGNAAPAPFTRRAQFAPRVLAPPLAAKRVEGVARGTQNGARLGDPPLASQPLAICELDPGALERPSGEVARQRLIEALARLCWPGDQRTRVPEGQRDPRTGLPTRDLLDLRHPCPGGIEPVDVHSGLSEIRDQPG